MEYSQIGATEAFSTKEMPDRSTAGDELARLSARLDGFHTSMRDRLTIVMSQDTDAVPEMPAERNMYNHSPLDEQIEMLHKQLSALENTFRRVTL